MNKLRIKQATIWIDSLCGSIAGKAVLAIFLFIVPATSIVYYGTDDFKSSIKSHYPELASWLDNHAFIFAMYTIGAIALEFIISHIIHSLAAKWRAPLKGDESMLINLVRAFNVLVKAKSDRFRDARKRVENGEISRDAIFDTITKPDQQIAIIAQQICDLFERIYLDSHNSHTDVFRVRILSVTNGTLGSFILAPENLPMTTPLETLRESGSTVSRCLSTKKPKFIPDIEVELTKRTRWYIASHNDVDDDQDKDRGSLYCYPVIYEQNVIYIICVSCRERGILPVKHKEFYKYVLHEFSERIKLEHHLINIKQRHETK